MHASEVRKASKSKRVKFIPFEETLFYQTFDVRCDGSVAARPADDPWLVRQKKVKGGVQLLVESGGKLAKIQVKKDGSFSAKTGNLESDEIMVKLWIFEQFCQVYRAPYLLKLLAVMRTRFSGKKRGRAMSSFGDGAIIHYAFAFAHYPFLVDVIEWHVSHNRFSQETLVKQEINRFDDMRVLREAGTGVPRNASELIRFHFGFSSRVLRMAYATGNNAFRNAMLYLLFFLEERGDFEEVVSSMCENILHDKPLSRREGSVGVERMFEEMEHTPSVFRSFGLNIKHVLLSFFSTRPSLDDVFYLYDYLLESLRMLMEYQEMIHRLEHENLFVERMKKGIKSVRVHTNPPLIALQREGGVLFTNEPPAPKMRKRNYGDDLHDIVSDVYSKTQREIKSETFLKPYLYPRFVPAAVKAETREFGLVEFHLVENLGELTEWGEMMDNCVASYDGEIKKTYSAIRYPTYRDNWFGCMYGGFDSSKKLVINAWIHFILGPPYGHQPVGSSIGWSGSSILKARNDDLLDEDLKLVLKEFQDEYDKWARKENVDPLDIFTKKQLAEIQGK